MKAAARIGVATVLLSTGCTAPPEALTLLVPESETCRGSYRRIPNGVRQPPPVANGLESVKPRLGVRMQGVGDDCEWSLTQRELPAIAGSTGTVATVLGQNLQMSSAPGYRDLVLLDTVHKQPARRTPLYDRADSLGDGSECRASSRRIKARVVEANRVLERSMWRPLEKLPVALGEAASGVQHRADVPASRRPVQVIAEHGEVIARVAGVRVLERDPLVSNSGQSVYSIDADRATGTVLVTLVACAGDLCTCDAEFTAHLIHWDDATFEEIERRPCLASDENDEVCAPPELF